MGFAGARAADKDSAALGIKKRAGREFAHLALVDRRVGKDEFVQILQHREFGSADTVADRAGLPVCAFGPDEAGDERIDLVTPGQSLACNLVKAGAHAVELRFGHGLQNLMAFHHATFRMLS
jgi:hypothetical protein